MKVDVADLASPMKISRVQPVLRVLSDGKVQVIGGDDAGSMEMFNPEAPKEIMVT